MVLLGIETATGPFSVALWKHGAVAALRQSPHSHQQSAQLLPMIEAMLAETQTTFSELTKVACSVGPGSFTSLRVGLAAARGLCLSLGIPGLGLTTLEIMAHGQQPKLTQPIITCLLGAGKGEMVGQSFVHDAALTHASEPRVARAEELIAAMPSGAALVSNQPLEQPAILAAPRADHLVMLAAKRGSGQPLSPFYVRPPDAKPMDTSPKRDMIPPALS